MKHHWIDYRREHGERHYALHRRLWVHDLPRLMPLCRLVGHRGIVDGYDLGRSRARWVACGRCGVRPDPQGELDPDQWALGQRYEGPFSPRPYVPRLDLRRGERRYPPGPWPAHPTGALDVEVVLGRRAFRVGAGMKIGNGGSENPIAAHVHLEPLGSLYFGTEGFGRGLQHRLNPRGSDSRVIEADIDHERLRWSLWARRNAWSRSDPRWMHGSVRLDPRDILLGDRRYSYEDVGDPVAAVVRMPHGDDHDVTLQLQRQRLGRPRGRRTTESWSVDWKAGPGIPTRPGDRGGIWASAVAVTDDVVADGTWPHVAAATVALDLTRLRARYDYQPPAADHG